VQALRIESSVPSTGACGGRAQAARALKKKMACKKNGMQEHGDAAEVQQEACAALVNLARGNEVTRELIRAAGAEELARAGLIEP
jgi:hypothetical protein